MRLPALLLLACLAAGGSTARAQQPSPTPAPLLPVGLARIDISPTHPVRLMGYASRAGLPPASETTRRLHARALAVGAGTGGAVLLTVDNCILPAAVTDAVRRRLGDTDGLAPERIAVTVTHTHSAPCLTGAAPNIFARDISPEDHAAIDRYTGFLIDRLVDVARAALADRQPARLRRGVGQVGFARNRRTADGPVDHDLPVLAVHAPDHSLRGILTTYACHCTTLGGEFNASHPDWAGVAADAIEAAHPGAVALLSIGAGADANPHPRGSADLADRHGRELAAEVERLLAGALDPVDAAPDCRLRTIALPYEPHFTRAQWEERSQQQGIVGYHATRWFARIDRGEPPAPTLAYPVQTWAFGTNLAMVFLGGEVVVDYTLRLRRELDADRLWIHGYANHVPGYIPSRRILQEGGYEAESSQWYYDQPQRLAPETEDRIVETVHDLLPAAFQPTSPAGPEASVIPTPPSPSAAVRRFRIAPGWVVEPVATEPLLASPVAIDFAADGRVWVVGMRDYPEGLDGAGQPGGTVSVLSDTDRDGRLDHAEPVADGLPFPTGILAWGDGAIVAAAPDVWFVAPGRREKLLTGFETHNFQARVNGFRRGLDGWIHASGGLFGGRVTVVRTGRTVDARQRDFRWKPDTGDFEPLAGVSQQGLDRDDFGNWFGNDNSTLLWHFVLPPGLAGRNPHVPLPDSRSFLNADDGRVFPASETLLRFNDPGMANHLTSACGPAIHRSRLPGDPAAGHAFVCEPVHNLVRRAELVPDGPTFRTRRPDEESDREFLASTDPWFRPVEVRTGPDGTLWVVDFHRFVVEHPRWIPPERLRGLDVRAGADTGRIWRVRRADHRPGPLPVVRGMAPDALITALASPVGPLRDLAQGELERRWDTLDAATQDALRPSLRDLATAHSLPEVRAQAWAVRERVMPLDEPALRQLLADADPRVRRLGWTLLRDPRRLGTGLEPAVESALSDPDPGVRLAVALALGNSLHPATGDWLGRLARRDGADRWIRAAVLAAVPRHAAAFARHLVAGEDFPGRPDLLSGLVLTAAGTADPALLARLIRATRQPDAPSGLALRLAAAIARRGFPSDTTSTPADPADDVAAFLRRQLPRAEAAVTDPATGETARTDALVLLGESARTEERLRDRLLDWFHPGTDLPAAARPALRAALRRQEDPDLWTPLMADWDRLPVGVRSELAELCLARPDWTATLVAALEAGRVGVGELDAATRERLLNAPDPAIRGRVGRLLPRPDPDRAAVVARHAGATRLQGNPGRGQEHFDRLCAGCHRVRGRGHEVGPDLTYFRAKPAADFLLAILDPGAAVEPRYLAYEATLHNGRQVVGILRSTDATRVTLTQSGGLSETFPRDDVARLSALPGSLMPTGLEEGMSDADLADLIAWLRGTPGLFGGATPEQSDEARRTFRPEATPLQRLESTEAPLAYPGWLGRLPLHVCRQDDGASRMTFVVPGDSPATDPVRIRLPVAMGFASQPAGHFTLHAHGRASVDFDVRLDDAAWRSDDGRLHLRYTVQERNAEDGCGVLEIEVAAGVLPAGQPAWFEVVGSPAGSQRWFGIYRLP